MFKICNDKTYYVVQTTSEDVVVEIYTKKDGRGSDINLHEMHLDLCRAIRKLQHDGYTIMKVYPAMGDRRESIDVLAMPEFIQSAKCPDNDVAFTYCDARKEAFEMYGTENWMAMAVVDFVASKLEGSAEGDNAASMVKKMFGR